MTGGALLGYVDESYEPGRLYVLAAVLADDAEHGPRDALRALLTDRRKRVHFHDDDLARRMRAATTVAGLGMRLIAAVRRSTDRPERSRAKCLTALVWHVGPHADGLVIEARSLVDNRRDRATLARVRAAKGPALRVAFAPAAGEPLLWAADVVAGAAAASLLRGQHGPYAVLSGRVQRVEVD